MDENLTRSPEFAAPPSPPRSEDPPLQAAAEGSAAPAPDAMGSLARLERRLVDLEIKAVADAAKLLELERKLQAAMGVNQRLGRGLQVVARRAEALQANLAQLDTEPAPGNPFGDVFVGKVTGFNVTSGLYTWNEQASVGGTTLADYTDGRTSTSATDSFLGGASEINGWRNIPTGTMVLAIEAPDLTTHRYHVVVTIPAPADETKDYVLAYDGTNKKMVWVETTTSVVCP